MAGLSKLSDEDLTALSQKQYDKLSDEGLQYLHAQSQPAPSPEKPNLVERAVDFIPGMRKRREDISVQRQTPDYKQSHPEPSTGMEDPAYQAAGLVSPGGITGLGGLLRNAGNSLMQKSVGASKVIPGLGEQFAQQGLIGTKGMMAGQVDRGLASSGQKIGELSSQIPNPVSQDAVANNVAELANKKMTPSGFVRPEDKAEVDELLSKAQHFATSEPLPGGEMAARRANSGTAAREMGRYKDNPSLRMQGKVAEAEQAGYSEALKKAYADSFPGSPEALADADKQYSVLSTAKSHLDKTESAGGLKDFLGQFVPTSLMESTAGRSAIGTGKLIQRAPLNPSSVPSLYKMLKPNSYSSEDR